MEDQLPANDPENTNQFGKGGSLVIGEDFILIGDPDDDSFEGSVTVFLKGANESWVKDRVLKDPNAMLGDRFGSSVARDGQFVIVGSVLGDDLMGGTADTGSVLIYDMTALSVPPVRLAIPPSISLDDQFGFSVDILANSNPPLAIVGAPCNDATSVDAGAVAIYKFDGASWVWVKTIACPVAGNFSNFGTDVAITRNPNISGEVEILIGAPADSVTGGDAFLYRLITPGAWTMTQHFSNPRMVAGDRYGLSVAIDEDFAFISAPDSTIGGMSSSGAAYVYRRDALGWPLSGGYEERIVGDSSSDHLGNDLALVRTGPETVRAVVGVHADYEFGTNSGAVRFMDRSVAGIWSDQTIYPVYGTDDLQFGSGVAMHVGSNQTRIVVGAFQGDFAQVFDVDRSLDGFTGPVLVEPHATPGRKTFKTYGIESNSTAHFLFGTQRGSAPYLGCATAFQTATFIDDAAPDPYGQASIVVDLPTITIPVGLQVAEIDNATGLCVSISVPVLL